MSIEKKPPVPSLLVITEPQIVVKNEPLEPEIVEIGIDDILGSSDEEISSDINSDLKDIDIVEHILCEDTIKTETVPKNILDSKHSKSVETQIIVKTENVSFMKTENLTPSENLNKTVDASNRNVSRGTGPAVVEIQGSNEDFNALENLETDELVINVSDDLNDISIKSGKPEHPKKTDFAKSSKTSETTSLKGDKEEIKVIKAPVVPVELHEYTSLSKDKYVCNHCQFACKKLNYVKYHIKTMHRKINTMYQCSNCPFQAKWRNSVRHHIIREHKDIKDNEWLRCHLCDKKFKLKYQLAGHILTHEQRLELVCPPQKSRKILKCHECKYTSLRKERLKYHIKAYHMKPENLLESDQEKRYRCDECNYKTYRPDILNTHKLIHLKPEFYQCYHCAYKSTKRINFTTHLSAHFRKGEVPFHCYICDFVAPKRNLLIEHIEKHAKDLKYRCNRCDYKTFTYQILKEHKLRHFKPEEIQYFYCYHCSYKSSRKDTLKSHIFRHIKKEEIKFHCYICDFMTLKRDLITEHIKKHSKVNHFKKGEIKFHCYMCDFMTLKRDVIAAHIKNHSKVLSKSEIKEES